MKSEQVEKVLAQAAVDIAFRERLVKGEVDVKSEFGLSDERVKVLGTLLAGEGAPGLQALLNVVVATPTMATLMPATIADVQRLTEAVEKKIARLESLEEKIGEIVVVQSEAVLLSALSSHLLLSHVS